MTEPETIIEISERKSIKILFVTTLLLFLAASAVLVGLWMSIRNEKTNSNLAASSGAESGQVLGASTQDPDYLVSLANNLKTAGFVLYGYDTNAESKKQVLVFGQALPNLDYVECDSQATHSNSDECLAKGIEDYPTWVKGEQKFVGFKSLSELEEMLAVD